MKLHLSVTFVIILATLPVLVQAQDSSWSHIDSLGQVVVTGLSRATLIRNNPVAIVSVTSRTIDRMVEPTIIDALVKAVPGLSAVKTGPNISKPFIRGLGYNRVLTLYDGMRQEGQQWGDEHGLEVDAYSISKAEVIKGPASLQFGSDALAGVVSLFPWFPSVKDRGIHGRYTSEFQHNNGLTGNGARLGYNDGKWMWAARGSYRIARNYSNAIDGRVYNTGFRETNAAVSIGYTLPKGSSTLHLTLYDNLQGIPDGSRDSLTREFTKQTAEGDMDDIKGRPLVTEAALTGYELSPLHQHIQHYRIYSNNHYTLGAGSLDLSLGYQQNRRREYSHPTEPSQAGLYLRLNTINYSVRYGIPLSQALELTTGINGMIQDNKSLDATDKPIPDYRLFDIGPYVYLKWQRGPLTITGGVRYDIRKLRLLDLTGMVRTFQGLSLSAGTAWQFNDQLSIKANISRGYRSPSITELASNGLDPGAHIIYLGNRGFSPEFSLQQDLGFIGSYRDIGFSASIFNNHIRNYIYLNQQVDDNNVPIVDAQGNRTFQYQASSARLYGAELTLDIHPSFIKGFSSMHSLVLTYGINQNKSYEGKGVAGEYLPLIPPARWTSMIGQSFDWNRGLLSSFSLRGELEYNAAQHRYLALSNTESATVSYALINASAGFTFHRLRGLQLQLQVLNLTNLSYQSNLSRLKYFEYYATSPGNHFGIYNMGRNICVKMILEF